MDYSKQGSERRLKKDARVYKKITHTVSGLITRAVMAAVLIGAFAAAAAGIGVYLTIIARAPAVNVQIQPQIYTSFIYDSKTGDEIQELQGDENRIYATISQMPKNLTNAFVAIEDERFYQHDGVDFKGMVRAAVTAVQTMGARTEGASTITQQLIKNNVMKRNSNTIITKLQEQYMAVAYERELEKPQNLGGKEAAKNYILEVYINTICLGHNYYGVQTAAKNYFGKDVSELTLSECAVIAAITKNPTKNAPDTYPDKNRERAAAVLDNMLRLGMITREEYDQAYNDNVYDRIIKNGGSTGDVTVISDYYNDALISQVSQDLQDQYVLTPAEASNWIYNGGLQIYSAQDRDMQDIMDSVVNDDSYYPPSLYEVDVTYAASVKDAAGRTQNVSKKATVKTDEEADAQVRAWKDEILTPGVTLIAEQIFKVPQPQVDMVIEDYHTGLVKAISGGRGEKTINRGLNRATSSPRQPGSVFKILASYAPGIDMGVITPGTLIKDEPFEYNGWQFHNWWGSAYRGWQTVRSGITQSMNILAVKNLVDNVGIDNAYAYLKNFGFTTLVDGETRSDGKYYTDKTASMALGGLTDGVTQLEVTAAYGTIANGGEYLKPSFYTKVLDHDGKVLLENNPEPKTVISTGAAYVMTNMMEDVIRNGAGRTGAQAAFRDSRMPEAGKTGTTTETKDLTFVGYTPYYAAGVWSGYDMPKAMKFKSGENGSYHLVIWREVMERIHAELPLKNFDMPDSVATASVCRDSGLLAGDLCAKDGRGSRVFKEIFVLGTQPAEYCDMHQIITLDTSTNMRANAYCPPDAVRTIVGIVTPDDSVTDTSWQIPQSAFDGPECIYHGPDAAAPDTPPPPDGEGVSVITPETEGGQSLSPETAGPENTLPPESAAPPDVLEPSATQWDGDLAPPEATEAPASVDDFAY